MWQDSQDDFLKFHVVKPKLLCRIKVYRCSKLVLYKIRFYRETISD